MKPISMILAAFLAASPPVVPTLPEDPGTSAGPAGTPEASQKGDRTDLPAVADTPHSKFGVTSKPARPPGKTIHPTAAKQQNKKAPGQVPPPVAPGMSSQTKTKAHLPPATAGTRNTASGTKTKPTKEVIAVNRKQAPAVVLTQLVKHCDTNATTVVVDLGLQRAYLLIGDQVAVDTPVSTGKKRHRTKTGTFRVTERIRTGKISNLYGSSMPYWQRIGKSPIGLHTGKVPGYPDSHGCVRLPAPIAPLFYSCIRPGTKVHILNKWDRKRPSSLSGLKTAFRIQSF